VPWPRPRTATGTGWSGPTAGCSPSATPASRVDGRLRLDQPITGIAPTPDGLGYWLWRSDARFRFGDAGFFGFGAGAGDPASAPLISIEPTPTGDGYWIIGSDGSVFSYGDAQFPGSLVHEHLAAPVTGASW